MNNSTLTNLQKHSVIIKSVACIPILGHDKTSYSLTLPLTMNKTTQGECGIYSDHFYITKMVGNYIKNNTFLLCLLAVQLLFIALIFTTKF